MYKKNLFNKKIIKKIYLTKKIIKINIKNVNKNHIKKLNKKYRNKNNYTDVLTFKYKKNTLIADIIFCKKIITKKDKKKCCNEIIIHSILHILDYDHYNKKDHIIMKKIEKKIGMSGIEPPTITTSK